MNRRRRELKRKAAAMRMAAFQVATVHQQGFIATTRPTLSYSALAVALVPVFIIAGITAPIWIGQTIARLLTSMGISSYLTIWLVPASSILVVVLFWKLYKRLGFQT